MLSRCHCVLAVCLRSPCTHMSKVYSVAAHLNDATVDVGQVMRMPEDRQVSPDYNALVPVTPRPHSLKPLRLVGHDYHVHVRRIRHDDISH
jgi:hypothetical protein